jgi:hypothetical protein
MALDLMREQHRDLQALEKNIIELHAVCISFVVAACQCISACRV